MIFLVEFGFTVDCKDTTLCGLARRVIILLHVLRFIEVINCLICHLEVVL